MGSIALCIKQQCTYLKLKGVTGKQNKTKQSKKPPNDNDNLSCGRNDNSLTLACHNPSVWKRKETVCSKQD